MVRPPCPGRTCLALDGLNQFNCALTIIEIQPHLPPLITFNDIGHLPPICVVTRP